MINFSKSAEGLIPAIIQDNETLNVLMLGYMNAESFQKTESKNIHVLWTRSISCNIW